MLPLEFNTIGEIAGVVISIGGAGAVIYRIFAYFKKKKERYRRDILKEARTEVEAVRENLEGQIKALEQELETQKANVSKDLAHLKETYNAEIKALGDKIEILRQDLTSQHQSLVALLTQLINR